MWLLGEVRNLLMNVIRSYFATVLVYQSQFVKTWWEQRGWATRANSYVIYNGVDLEKFSKAVGVVDEKTVSILCVEGTLDYSPFAVEMLNIMQERLIEASSFKSLILHGSFGYKESQKDLSSAIDYRGFVDRGNLPSVYRNCVYLSLDVNPACPNTVVEALASGIPVIGFDTGALRELVTEDSGYLVPYGGNGPWELDFPDIERLVSAATRVLADWDKYSTAARKVAEERFDVREMASNYLSVINSVEKSKKSAIGRGSL